MAGLLDALAFEATKLASLRSNRWTLLIAAVVTLGLTGLVGGTMGSSTGPAPFDALQASFLALAEYGVAPLTVLGVLAFTSEYGTGLIRTTFTAVPRRGRVLAAKALVAGAAALVTGEGLAFGCFGLTQALVGARHGGLSLAHPGVLPAVLAAGLVLPACTLVGLAAGAIVRHTAGAIAAALTVVYLLAALSLALPAPWGTRLGRFTMPFAAFQLISLHPHAGLLPSWASLLVLLAWPAAALALAATALARRDA